MEYELPKLLRAWADYLTEEVRVVPAAIRMIEAANRIDELETALREITQTAPFGRPQEIARAALEEKKDA
jgi:hypothetical protein